MMSREEAERVLSAALETAKQGVDGAEVSLVGGTLGVARFADNEVHQSGQLAREVLSVRVLVGDRAARAETSDITMTGLKIVARQARMMAELMPRQPEPVTLAGPGSYRALDDFDADTERAGALDRTAIAGRAILRAAHDGLLASGYVATSFGGIDRGGEGDRAYAMANSQGLFAYHAGTRVNMSVTMMKPGGGSGWAEGQAFALGALDAGELVERAVFKATVKGSPRALEPGSYRVILEPSAVAGLLAPMIEAVGASDLEAGRSFLSGRLGERVTGERIHLADDAAHPLHRGAPFDAEGVPRRRVSILEAGVAKGCVHSLASARRAKVEPTGHRRSGGAFGDGEAAEHLVMMGTDEPLEALLEGVERAVLVTRLWYVQTVDPRKMIVTGVTRDGTFLVEGGQIVAPLRDMRFNVNVLELLERADMLSEVEWASGMVVPGLRAEGFPLVAAALGA